MNLAQMKIALENSVKEALQMSLDQGIEVNTSYDANTGTMLAELKNASEVVDGRSNILCYTIRYAEETKEIAIVAFNRVFVHDNLGIGIVNNEPVAINNKFMTDIAQIIEYGMDKVYHPENYVQPEPEVDQPADGEIVLDGSAE